MRQTPTASAARRTLIDTSPRASCCLDDRLRFVAARAATGDLDGVEIEDGNCSLHALSLRRRRWRARLLLASRTCCRGCGSPRCWPTSTPGRSLRPLHPSAHGNPAAKPALLAAILSDGTNVVLSRLADTSLGQTDHYLVDVAQWHIAHHRRRLRHDAGCDHERASKTPPCNRQRHRSRCFGCSRTCAPRLPHADTTWLTSDLSSPLAGT